MPAAPFPADAGLLLPAVFNALPGAFVLLSPELRTEAVSDDFLTASLTTREQLLGRLYFEVFPDNPTDPNADPGTDPGADGARTLRAALEQVRATGQRHTLSRQRHDIPDPARPGQLLARHWLLSTISVPDAQGQLRYFLLSIVDVTAQVQAEAELAATLADEQTARAEAEAKRQRFYEVLMALPAQVATFHGPDHVYQFVNTSYQACFPTYRFPGRPLREVIPQVAGLGVLTAFDRVYQTGEPHYVQELEGSFDFKGNGQPERVFLDLFLHPLRNAQGQIDGVIDFSYDVTEPVLARRALEQLNHELEDRVAARSVEARQAHAAAETQKQRLERLFQQAPAAICILGGPDFVYELVNPAYQAFSPGRTLLGKPLLEAVPEAAGREAYAVVQQVYQTGVPFAAPALLIPVARTEDGVLEDRYFNLLQQPRYNEHDQIDGVLAFCLEVTAQVQAQQRAEQSEARFRHLAETTPLIVWEADAAGHTTYLSPRWEQFTTAANGQGLGWRDYIHPDDRTAFVRAWQTAVATGQPFQAELRLRLAATGEYRWHLDQAVPVRDAAGRIVQWVGAATDIEEQKQLAQHLERLTQKLRQSRDEAQTLNAELTLSNEQLVRTNADLDNFIYTASHDLKAPITNIEGLLLALRAELLPQSPAGEVTYILDLIQDAVDRFQHTIEHLTDVTKLQKENAQPAQAVRLAEVIEDVRLDLAPLLQQTRGQLDVDVRATPTVQFSEKNLRSVVHNLLSNALKYRHPDRAPRVRLRSRPEAGGTRLEVHDNGLGLETHQQDQLFTMFRRLHSHVEGAGIGLYMVKKIVENAGGRIAVESQPGVGSTFSIWLPGGQ